jgi:LmbE family N-acetylglucosaminyl deacetylase
MRFDERLEIERAMVIFAHPDDAEFGSSGTVAAWARAGVEVVYVMVTNGASGSSDPTMTRERLAAIRAREQRQAAGILGVREVVFLGFEDGYLEPSLEVRRAVAREIRRHRPDAVFAPDPTRRWWPPSYINHPDHIAVGEVVMRSINPDASTRLMFPELWAEEGLEPHRPRALFVVNPVEPDTFVDITDTIELKVKALEAHASQVGDWPVGEFVRERARQAGQLARERGLAGPFEYAEAFRLFRLDEG